MASEVMRLLRQREPEVCEVPVVNLHGLGVRFFDVIGFFSVFPRKVMRFPLGMMLSEFTVAPGPL